MRFCIHHRIAKESTITAAHEQTLAQGDWGGHGRRAWRVMQMVMWLN